MPDWFVTSLPAIVNSIFVFAFGACVGSLINVLVYRLPLGLDVIRPTSRCPACSTKLTFRENIPIFGWLLLGGKCRFCRSRISAEYPAVELFTALTFVGLYLLWYVVPGRVEPTEFGFGSLAPEWARNGIMATWPIFLVLLTLVSCLIAMTLVDAKTFTIPLVLAWVPAAVAVVVLPAHAFWFSNAYGPLEELEPGRWLSEAGRRWISADGWVWALPTPGPTGWNSVGAALGGTLGLGVSILLLKLGLIRQSFADYEEWENAELEKLKAEAGDADDQEPINEAAMWIQYPHSRREMLKEVAYLGAPVGLAWIGATFLPGMIDGDVSLWLRVLAGVLLGYLIGGVVVWGVRILGSLAFGKEAMGLGDVHLMAGVGACLGAIDPVLAFFGAAFLGTGWEAGRRLLGSSFNRALPYGPHLAAATMLVVILKPLVEAGLTQMFSQPVDLP